MEKVALRPYLLLIAREVPPSRSIKNLPFMKCINLLSCPLRPEPQLTHATRTLISIWSS